MRTQKIPGVAELFRFGVFVGRLCDDSYGLAARISISSR
jgi:hypothetical protein